jgi:hypothetical protein
MEILGAHDNELYGAIHQLVGTKEILGAHDIARHNFVLATSCSFPWSVRFRNPSKLFSDIYVNNKKRVRLIQLCFGASTFKN